MYEGCPLINLSQLYLKAFHESFALTFFPELFSARNKKKTLFLYVRNVSNKQHTQSALAVFYDDLISVFGDMQCNYHIWHFKHYELKCNNP